jgi:hypothetical protein
MKVSDLIGYVNGDGPTGIVLDIWQEWQSGPVAKATWVRILWDDGTIGLQLQSALEKINESR